MYVYWVEQCKYCKQHSCDEGYKAKVMEYIKKLRYLEKVSTGVYGTTRFNCDYFVFDTEKYLADNPGDCQGC